MDPLGHTLVFGHFHTLKKRTFTQPFKKKGISKVAIIGSIVVFNLKFLFVCTGKFAGVPSNTFSQPTIRFSSTSWTTGMWWQSTYFVFISGTHNGRDVEFWIIYCIYCSIVVFHLKFLFVCTGKFAGVPSNTFSQPTIRFSSTSWTTGMWWQSTYFVFISGTHNGRDVEFWIIYCKCITINRPFWGCDSPPLG